MAKQYNDLDPHLRRLLDTLTRVDHQSSVAASRAQRDRARGEQSLQQWQAAGSPPQPFGTIFGAGAALPISDPFAADLAYFPYASIAAGAEHYLDVLDEVNRRIQAESLVIVYEEMERFFKALGSHLFWKHRRHSTSPWPLSMKFTLVNRRHAGTAPYYESYVNWLTYRNCAELLKLFEELLPAFRNAARTNPRGQDLVDAYKALEFCRHTTVHSAGRINEAQVERLPASARAIINQVRHLSVLENDIRVLPERPIAGELISWMADLSYVLYRVASNDCDLTIGFAPAEGWA